MWLLNALGVVPIIVSLFAVALAYQCASVGNISRLQGRYPRMLFFTACTLSMAFVAVVLMALGILLLVYDATPLIVRYGA